MPAPLDGWWKAWFPLRNDANMPLHSFTVSRPVPHPNWGHGVSQTDLHRLQPLLKVIRGLLQRGLTGVKILQIFSSRGVHPLRRREANVWMSLGLSCPGRPFSMESGNMEIPT
jgi:hypothetical protein